MYVYICIYIYVYVYIHMYMYIYIQRPVLFIQKTLDESRSKAPTIHELLRKMRPWFRVQGSGFSHPHTAYCFAKFAPF